MARFGRSFPVPSRVGRGRGITLAAQVIAPSLYQDAEVFQTPVVAATYALTAPLYDDADAFFTHTIAVETLQTLLPPLYDDTEAFFAPTVLALYALTPALYVDNDTFFTQVVASTYALTPALYADADAFFTQVVFTTYALTPALYADADAFFTQVALSTYALTTPLYVDAEAFFTQVVSAGAVNLAPPLYADAEAFFTQVVSATYSLTPTLYVDAEAFFTQVALSTKFLTPSLYADAEAFFTQVVTPGSVNAAPPLYTDAEAFFTPVVNPLVVALATHATLSDASNLTTYTFASAAIGAAAFDRIVIVGIVGRRGGADRSLSSVTIGGVTATIVANPGTVADMAAIAIANVPTGTTATIVVTFSGDMARCGIQVWSATRMTTLVTSVNTADITSPYSTTVNIPAGGVGFGVVFDLDNSASATWAGLTENSDGVLDVDYFSSASRVYSATQTGITVSSTLTSSGGGRMAVVTFGPTLLLAPALYDDADTFFEQTIASLGFGLFPPLYADTDTFFAPVVFLASQFLTPALYADTDTFFAPTVLSIYALTAPLYDDTDTFFAPTVLSIYALTAPLYDDADVFFAPVVSAGAAGILPPHYVDVDVFYQHLIPGSFLPRRSSRAIYR